MGTEYVASLENMVRLGDLLNHVSDGQTEAKGDELEGRGKATTPAEQLEGRNGYQRGFLKKWSIELPMPGDDEDILELRRGGKGVELKYQNFSVIMSKSRKLPILTAVNIFGENSVSIKRSDDKWFYDGRINEEDQWGNDLYNSNALDRGHMVRREDPVWGELAQQANDDTFHFTNCCPQIAGVNQQTWLGLENYILQNARADNMKVSVFTGPVFANDDLEYRGAQIPASFWKVVAIVKDDGHPSATGYVISQEKELSELEIVYSAYKTFQVSIQQIMNDTGIDFSNLLKYDGFTQHEKKTSRRVKNRIETLGDIMV